MYLYIYSILTDTFSGCDDGFVCLCVCVCLTVSLSLLAWIECDEGDIFVGGFLVVFVGGECVSLCRLCLK